MDAGETNHTRAREDGPLTLLGDRTFPPVRYQKNLACSRPVANLYEERQRGGVRPARSTGIAGCRARTLPVDDQEIKIVAAPVQGDKAESIRFERVSRKRRTRLLIDLTRYLSILNANPARTTQRHRFRRCSSLPGMETVCRHRGYRIDFGISRRVAPQHYSGDGR